MLSKILIHSIFSIWKTFTGNSWYWPVNNSFILSANLLMRYSIVLFLKFSTKQNCLSKYSKQNWLVNCGRRNHVNQSFESKFILTVNLFLVLIFQLLIPITGFFLSVSFLMFFDIVFFLLFQICYNELWEIIRCAFIFRIINGLKEGKKWKADRIELSSYSSHSL